MKTLKGYIKEKEEEEAKQVDDAIDALDEIDVDSTVYDGGENFNVAFKAGDTEYYIRPNDKGEEMFYIDADIDDFDSFKVKDKEQLKSEVKKLIDKD